jgi:hypothetical protein
LPFEQPLPAIFGERAPILDLAECLGELSAQVFSLGFCSAKR